MRQKTADVDQISAKKQEAALAAKQRYELLLGRKAWLENAVRQQERTVRARQQAVEEAERALLTAQESLAEAVRVLEKAKEELAAM